MATSSRILILQQLLPTQPIPPPPSDHWGLPCTNPTATTLHLASASHGTLEVPEKLCFVAASEFSTIRCLPAPRFRWPGTISRALTSTSLISSPRASHVTLPSRALLSSVILCQIRSRCVLHPYAPMRNP